MNLTHNDLALATAAGKPFTRVGWIWELKYDGFRALAIKEAGLVRLLSRNGRSLNGPFPELVDELHRIPGDFAIDGELVVLDERGHPQFEQLSARSLMTRKVSIEAAKRDTPAAVFAFDLLAIGGKDLRARPLLEREAQLERLLKAGERVRYLNHIGENGERLFEEVAKLELEGIVGKRADAPYTAGRCRHGVKIKTPAGRAREALRLRHLREGR